MLAIRIFQFSLFLQSAIFVYFLLICGVLPTAHPDEIDDRKKTLDFYGSKQYENSHSGGGLILSRKKRQVEEEFVARLQLFICNFESHFTNDDDVDVDIVEIGGP